MGELMCHLPLFLLAATCASLKTWGFFTFESRFSSRSLLPPFRVSQETINKCLSEENQAEAPASSVDSVVALLRAGKPAISDKTTNDMFCVSCREANLVIQGQALQTLRVDVGESAHRSLIGCSRYYAGASFSSVL